jgi:biopolymer transport protein ExbD
VQFERRKRNSQHINMTPLIDVIFLLIVYLMITTSFVQINSIELSLPDNAQEDAQTIAATHVRDQDIILIDIGANHALYLNNIIISEDELEDTIRTQFKRDKDRQVLIRASSEVNVQQLVDMMDMVQQAGGTRMTVDKWNEPEAATAPILPVRPNPVPTTGGNL